MQIWKSPYMFVFIQKQYPENFAFLILRILKLFAREFSVPNPDSIFGDTVYSCYCKLRLVTPFQPPLPPPLHTHTHTYTMVGAEGTKIFNLITLDRWKRHFREKNYIENYFYFLKNTKSTKTTSQKCWVNIIWADFFGRSYRTNCTQTRLGSPVILYNFLKSRLIVNIFSRF